ncbi:MAG: glycosyltransferase [Patescibacteria group bacterium]|nr:glycosyltransferase [Patescibacteria group bacterium]
MLFSNNGSKDSPIYQKWKGDNIQYIHTNIPNKFFSIFLRLGIIQMDKWIEKHSGQKIDILWIPDPRPFSCSRQTYLVSTFHDLSFEHYKHTFTLKTRLFQQLTHPKKLSQKSDKIISVSQFTKKDIQEYYKIPGEKISVIYE